MEPVRFALPPAKITAVEESSPIARIDQIALAAVVGLGSALIAGAAFGFKAVVVLSAGIIGSSIAMVCLAFFAKEKIECTDEPEGEGGGELVLPATQARSSLQSFRPSLTTALPPITHADGAAFEAKMQGIINNSLANPLT